jgi:hypothetical protein
MTMLAADIVQFAMDRHRSRPSHPNMEAGELFVITGNASRAVTIGRSCCMGPNKGVP